ncbi:uncharacterized protein B0P05DRAFT_587472 [Gilbertella persicaria]|uniref:uncharacterized protein n=1 Tax=Gilbertella persicaria TaxID=101096 RepID=UPI0022211A43|nr:uncharacterized protein B0P05DRAFT_587472 [Gilbertella persicaria]KAI8078248.1 hypothetical protein B0P05DRAFT_587472 [Gilbertella persicaria]
MGKLPLDIQQIICRYAVLRDKQGAYNSQFVVNALIVSKAWAYFVCRIIYRHYRIRNYLAFVGFVKTITSNNTFLPYGHFVRSIDFTPVNKYGIDMRVHRLFRCCPYIVQMTLGHPTTLKSETIREITRYNTRLHTLSMGGIESFPFMLECDFSGMKQLEHVTLKTTPLLSSSFMTLPIQSLRSIRLIQMDAIQPHELLAFCQTHTHVQAISIINCKALLLPALGSVLAQLAMHLKTIELEGYQITDELLFDLFTKVPKGTRLERLLLANTQITSAFVHSLPKQPLQVRQLELVNNRYV